MSKIKDRAVPAARAAAIAQKLRDKRGLKVKDVEKVSKARNSVVLVAAVCELHGVSLADIEAALPG